MRALSIGAVTLLVALSVVSPAGATTRQPLTYAQAKSVVVKAAHSALDPSVSGTSKVGTCARLAAWKVICDASLRYVDGTTCVTTYTVANSRLIGAGKSFRRTWSRDDWACDKVAYTPTAPTTTTPLSPVTTPTPSPVVPVVPVVPVTPTLPITLPQALGEGVARAYVGGMMANARATTGGVSFCNQAIGTSVMCDYSYSGLSNAGSFYYCHGFITVNGVYYLTGWQTTVDLGLGPFCS